MVVSCKDSKKHFNAGKALNNEKHGRTEAGRGKERASDAINFKFFAV